MSCQKAKLEAQYQAKQQAQASEVLDLKQQLDLKGNEIRSLNSTIENLKGVNEELKVSSWLRFGLTCLSPSAASICCNICWYRGW